MVHAGADMAHRDCVFRVPVPEEVDGVGFAECLAASVGRAEGDRQAAARSEDRCKGPAPEDMAKHPLLSGVEVRLVDKEQVVNEFTVKARQAVPPVQVEGVWGGGLAGCLDHRAGTERFGPGKVGLGS